MTSGSKSVVTGPLQERILLLLRKGPKCGKDLMQELRIKSPGTIYPALEELRKKGLISFEVEASGAVRKKNYQLTDLGKNRIRESLTSSARMFCCDMSLYLDRSMGDIRRMISIRKGQRILCTIEYEEARKHLAGADVTFCSDIEEAQGEFDVVLSFHGVEGLIRGEESSLRDHLMRVGDRLRPRGTLLLVEIEKTDNVFARILFEDVSGWGKLPGIDAEVARKALAVAGFANIRVDGRAGLLYAQGTKAVAGMISHSLPRGK